MTHDDVRFTLFDLGNALFPISYQTYLDTMGKQVWGLQIEPDQKRFTTLFGAVKSEDLALFNSSFHDTIAGYKIGARSVFSSLSEDADVFLLAKEALSWPSQDLVPIIIHELCHWYLDSGNQSRSPLVVTVTDRKKGKELYKRTDSHNEHRTSHTLQFCTLLCAVARRAVEEKKYCGSRDALVESAMRFDIDGGRI